MDKRIPCLSSAHHQHHSIFKIVDNEKGPFLACSVGLHSFLPVAITSLGTLFIATYYREDKSAGVHCILPVIKLGEKSARVHSFFPVVRFGRAIGKTFFLDAGTLLQCMMALAKASYRQLLLPVNAH